MRGWEAVIPLLSDARVRYLKAYALWEAGYTGREIGEYWGVSVERGYQLKNKGYRVFRWVEDLITGAG